VDRRRDAVAGRRGAARSPPRPTKEDVIFIVDGQEGKVYESDDGGAGGNSSWSPIGGTGQPDILVKRIPFVVTNQRAMRAQRTASISGTER